MKISQVLMAFTLALGLVQMAYADHHEMGEMPARHHGLQDADANKDGAISRDEFTEAHKVRSEKMFEQLDANHDGKIDQAEREARMGKMKDDCPMKGDRK